MKNGLKSIRNLLVPVIVFIFLLTAFLLARALIPNEVPETTAFSKTDFITLISLDPEKIRSVSVGTEDAAYFIITRIQSDESASQWSLDDTSEQYDPAYFSGDQIAQYIFNITNVVSDRVISVKDDQWSEFGLDRPSVKLIYNMDYGETIHIEIGAKTPDGNNYYARLNSGNQAYILPAETADTLDASLIDFFDRSVLNHTGEQIERFVFRRHSNEVSIVASPLEKETNTEEISGWQIIEPVEYRSGEIFNRLAYNALTLEIDGYIEDSTEAKVQYGLSDPEYEFEVMSSDGTATRYYLSREMSDKYYGYSDAINGIFYINLRRMAGLDASLMDYYFQYFTEESTSSVKSIEAIFPEGAFNIEIKFPEGMSIEHPDVIANVNHRAAKVTDTSGQSYFMMLFNAIMNIRISGIDRNALIENDPDISIRIIKNNSRVVLLEFTPADNKYYVFINATYSGFWVSHEEIYSENLEDPGVWFAYNLVNEALDGQINGKYDIPVS